MSEDSPKRRRAVRRFPPKMTEPLTTVVLPSTKRRLEVFCEREGRAMGDVLRQGLTDLLDRAGVEDPGEDAEEDPDRVA